MSGKVSTTNYKEYKADKSLIFIPKNTITYINQLKKEKVVRCDNHLCRRVLPYYQPRDISKDRFTTYLKYGKLNFCDKLCKEDYLLHKYNTEHKCKYCDKPALMYTTKGGRIAGWSETCDYHSRKSKEKENKIERDRMRMLRKLHPSPKKEKDSVGHLCKKCGVYKTWDMFPNTKQNRSGKGTTCLECLKVNQKKYYEKNKMQNKSTTTI